MRSHVRRTIAVLALACITTPLEPAAAAQFSGKGQEHSKAWQPSVVVRWNQALLEAVRRTGFRPMWTARALAIVHTSMFDAWAAYDQYAVGVYWDHDLRRPRPERTRANAEAAVNMAAYRALVDLFPSQRDAIFAPLLRSLGLDPADESLDVSRPVGLGNLCAFHLLAARHDDGANQLGDRNSGTAYSDYTNYAPMNTPDHLTDPNRWQPLRTADGTVQVFLAPQWRHVAPFALSSPDQFRPPPPPQYPDQAYIDEVEAIRVLSAGLTDRQKVIAEYWADGPATETPPGHWSLFAQFVSERDRNTLAEDIALFFALGNAVLDASIAVWDAKVAYDYVRPISAVRFVFGGAQIEAWGGPGLGTQLILGSTFRSYLATPPFAEYTSGHSAFSAAAAAVLEGLTGSARFDHAFTFGAGKSLVEPDVTPATDVTLRWRTFREAADQAGLSRRFGGIHFRRGDVESRRMGARIGWQALNMALRYMKGRSVAGLQRSAR